MKIFELSLPLLLVGLLLVQGLPDRGHDHDDDDDHEDHDHDDDDDDDNNKSDKRLCPEGYSYIGDDPKHRLNRDYILDEAERSPVYSCYKIFKTPATWMSANLRCIEDKGQLASFEDLEEITNFDAKFGRAHGSVDALTSAIHFGLEPAKGWLWIGSNSSIDSAMMATFPEENFSNETNQCLVLHMEARDANVTDLKAVSCLEPQPAFVCEIRVQTVTYYAWFVANWFTFLLIFLLIVLVLSLCVSMTMYSKKTSQRERVYRGRSRQMTSDLPPSYSDAQRKVAPQPSRMDTYRNKGKELLAKVYLYKDGQKVVANN